MRFCMVTTFYPPFNFGGDGVFVHQLANELAKRGHDVEVVHSADAYRLMGGPPPSTDYLDHPNVAVHALKSPLGLLSPLATQQTGRPILESSRLEEILGKRFDVIHYHNISLVGGPRILRYGRGIKLYTLHEYWLVCPTHMLFKFDRAVCTRRHCLACTLVHRRPPQLWRYTDMIAESVKHVDLFLAPSAFSRSKHLELGLEAPIVELPYFTSRWPDDGAPRGGPRPDPPYFLFVGRLKRLKGLQTLIPLFREYPRAQLRVVGVGDYEPALRRLARDSANIRFLGYQSGEPLRRLFEEAIAVVVPSLWHEVFGIVILEAFARGTPVIVSRQGGMPQVVDESGGGFVYDTEEELVHAMDRLLGDPDLREEMGRRGYRAFEQKWSAEPHIRRYLGLIEELAVARG
jgi:glycosyltransferase involved in cell wall biosynthesis